MKLSKRRIGLITLGIFIIIQFIRCDRTVPPVQKSENFVDIYNPPQAISSIIKNACYDCHSYESKYPLYSKIAPISWFIDNHIREGRESLNFSVFGTYSTDKKSHVLEEAAEEVAENKMPLASYKRIHSEAKLSEEERNNLVSYFETMSKEVSNNNTEATSSQNSDDEKDENSHNEESHAYEHEDD